MLLTDDVSTIEEVERYHSKDYKWIYVKRQRVRGTEGGFNGHIPSGDEGLEVITIMAEVKLASQCNKLVSGHSGFVTTITDAMDAAGKKYKKFYGKSISCERLLDCKEPEHAEAIPFHQQCSAS